MTIYADFFVCLNGVLDSCKLRKWNPCRKPESMHGLAEKCRACDLLEVINVMILSPATACVVVSLGKMLLSQFALLIRAHIGPVLCGEYYSLSADRVFTWPVAHHPR